MNHKKILRRAASFAVAGICLLQTFPLTGCDWFNREDAAAENGYYFDADAEPGGDGSKARPYVDFSVLPTLNVQPGETLYLKSGSEFQGGLRLVGLSGSAQQPITVTSYGGGAEDYAALNGNDLVGEGVLYVENCNYLTVEKLEIYDSARKEADRRGVLVNVTGDGGEGVAVYRGVTLRELDVHDIYGVTDAENSGMSGASKQTGGIHAWSADGRGRLDGFTVTQCRITNVDNAGIATWYMPGDTSSTKISPYRSDFETYAHSNVEISHNEISYIGKNAIFMRNLKGGVVEHNTVYETALRCVSGNQIVTCYVWGTVVQYNEGYLNRATVRPSDGAVHDGSMLDADLQSRDTLWQYNYSHDNAFGLFLNCTSYNPDAGIADKVTVRYNLSLNDKGRNGIVYFNYNSAGIEMYNNTIITATTGSPIIFQINKNENFSFYNNLIFNRAPGASFRLKEMSGASYRNNLVFGVSDSAVKGFQAVNKDGLYVDPLFVYSDLLDGDVARRVGYDKTEICRLLPASPALNAGMGVTGVAADLLENPYRPSIGCFCGVE